MPGPLSGLTSRGPSASPPALASGRLLLSFSLHCRSLGAPGGCCRGGLALLALGPSVGSFSSYQYPWLPVALSCWRFELNFFLPI
ncbi:uncharacterized protein OCT59_014463 [Rhizophagus irregularis]|uniref:uncharacterized protein n=1 Tax=Rhizophagus irregularis TaxID=588596 RepID=UPI003328161A|nr:hypothetical protein OCT59_014463 [Rhizophagus irregularis]